MIPWIIVGLLLLLSLMLFFFLIVHRRNMMRRLAELDEKILFFHPTVDHSKHSHLDYEQINAELNRLKETVARLQNMPAADATDKITREKIELFKRGIHQHLNELHERIKLNEINTNRMLHYLEDLRETLSQSEE